jgi:hypothetical protein
MFSPMLFGKGCLHFTQFAVINFDILTWIKLAKFCARLLMPERRKINKNASTNVKAFFEAPSRGYEPRTWRFQVHILLMYIFMGSFFTYCD